MFFCRVILEEQSSLKNVVRYMEVGGYTITYCYSSCYRKRFYLPQGGLIYVNLV